jgi:CheY-like chemotaxis protein
LSIIDDILDFSKIEAGKMELESIPFDLRECLESALDLHAIKASEKGLELAYHVDEGVPSTIVGDVTRLRQILLNLLSNAIKFTEEGEVVVTVRCGEVDGEDEVDCSEVQPLATIQFSVRDTGIGIPPDRVDRLFTSFSQVDASTTRKYGGSGLGLVISKRLSELMGGTMWVDSKVGVGSTFSFTIRVEPAPDLLQRAQLKGEQPQLQRKRLLVVDDNATNRRIVLLQTKNWGLMVRDTDSPRQALDWIRRGDPFDLALLDMHMPEMDGMMLAREIRKYRDPATLPLVLFSSLGRQELNTEEVGFAAQLTKPVKQSQLFEALMEILAVQTPVVDVTHKEASAKLGLDPRMAEQLPLRILLAEDNAVNQMLALKLLAKMGYDADVSENGLEAIQALERQAYDVILMDVQMPEMDGLEASRQINQRWSREERPRIIAMTANAMQGDREMCLNAGMDDYMAKPIRVSELVAALRRAKT